MDRLITILWDLWCSVSIIGIWPRFIEPKLLRLTHLKLTSPAFSQMNGLKILHISDLHFHKKSSNRYLKRISNKIFNLKPDLILFTGDFLCHSILEDEERLQSFLNSLNAPLGCFAIFGNHDYTSYVSRNRDGNYDVKKSKSTHFLIKAAKQVFSKKNRSPQVTERASKSILHTPLVNLLKKTPFQLLHNETVQIKAGNNYLNITGLGDYWAGKCLPELAFKNYDPRYPGIVLTHNPDTIKLILDFPGEFVFSGHTHGGQVNLPFIADIFLGLENKKLKRGLFTFKEKQLYVTRGIGAHQDFRLFSTPELVLVTLC